MNPNKPYDDPALLSKRQLAERLNVSCSTLDRWIRDCDLPVIYHPLGAGHGRPCRFDWAVIEPLVEIRRQATLR